ncbi:YceI family protein [Rufibacter hautae]|uniref:YceI family protein n=1 Tax=Rufibacter hautae TaxID=2595005 RepID=A0A5B6T6P3_9BACT|nr:YceI family protein [Rufibacter hautae]KAA3435938.1 YceI family protein [Rufibacter hautae]
MKTKNTLTRNFLFTALTIALALFVFPLQTQAQATYSLMPKAKVFLKVMGNSNVHDWEMVSSTMQSKGDFKFDAKHVLTSINAFQLTVDSKTLKSKHSSLDNRAYKVMKATQHPRIVYNLRATDITTLSKDNYLVKALGDLTIAGSRQIISMDVNVVVNPDNSITCTGTEKIKLSDYSIAAPSYMAGTMKVGNDLTIGFAQTYQK